VLISVKARFSGRWAEVIAVVACDAQPGTDDFRAAVASEALATGHTAAAMRALGSGTGTFP